MAFPAFDKQEDVPEAFRDDYEERDGKWRPKDEAAALKSALDEERSKRKAAEKATEKAAAELRDAQRDADAKGKGVTSEQLEALRADIRKDFETEHGAKFKRLEELEAENHSMKHGDVIKKHAGELKVLGDRLDDFVKLYGDQFALTTDGQLMVKDKPGVDPKKLVAELVKQQPGWVEGSKADGGGVGGDQTGGGSPTGLTFEELMQDPSKGLAAEAKG